MYRREVDINTDYFCVNVGRSGMREDPKTMVEIMQKICCLGYSQEEIVEDGRYRIDIYFIDPVYEYDKLYEEYNKGKEFVSSHDVQIFKTDPKYYIKMLSIKGLSDWGQMSFEDLMNSLRKHHTVGKDEFFIKSNLDLMRILIPLLRKNVCKCESYIEEVQKQKDSGVFFHEVNFSGTDDSLRFPSMNPRKLKKIIEINKTGKTTQS